MGRRSVACRYRTSSKLYKQIPTQVIQHPLPSKCYGKARTDDAANFGLNLSFGYQGEAYGGVVQNAFIELQYNYMKTGLEYDSYDGSFSPDYYVSDLGVHNIMLGITNCQGNKVVTGYGGVSAAAVNVYANFNLGVYASIGG